MSHAISIASGLIWKAAFDKRQWAMLLDIMLKAVGLPHALVELELLDDKDMAVLNLQTMNCQGPTNILSFPSGTFNAYTTNGPCGNFQGQYLASPMNPWQDAPVDPPGRARQQAEITQDLFLGSLALSLDTAAREASLYGQDLREHSIRLLAHGLAHLLGYDHSEEMDEIASIMEQACISKNL